jgi:ATP-dependent RNA circularization protein (DNA/RNA ligase family)
MVIDEGRVGVCSRDDDFLDNGENLFWNVARDLHIPEKILKIGGNVAIQGELCGSTIAKNSMGFAEGEHTFVVFAIFDIDAQVYWSVTKTERICRELGMAHAPVIAHMKLGQFAKDIPDLIQKAEGIGMKGRIREGLVFKTMDGQKQFKVISNSWLIQTGN